MEENKKEGRISRMRNDVVGFDQAVVGMNKFVVQFEDVQKRYMSAYSLSYVCDKEDVGEKVYKTIYDRPQNI